MIPLPNRQALRAGEVPMSEAARPAEPLYYDNEQPPLVALFHDGYTINEVAQQWREAYGDSVEIEADTKHQLITTRHFVRTVRVGLDTEPDTNGSLPIYTGVREVKCVWGKSGLKRITTAHDHGRNGRSHPAPPATLTQNSQIVPGPTGAPIGELIQEVLSAPLVQGAEGPEWIVLDRADYRYSQAQPGRLPVAYAPDVRRDPVNEQIRHDIIAALWPSEQLGDAEELRLQGRALQEAGRLDIAVGDRDSRGSWALIAHLYAGRGVETVKIVINADGKPTYLLQIYDELDPNPLHQGPGQGGKPYVRRVTCSYDAAGNPVDIRDTTNERPAQS